jgi:glycosyltransferase involved in cell wall biosynthesis
MKAVTSNNRPELSVVVPMYMESACVEAVVESICSHVRLASDSYEVIVVDDGSADDTWDRLVATAPRHPNLRAIRLSRNFGKENALSAGLEACRGAGVIVMDGDLQHPPLLIPEMVRCWRAGHSDIVEAVKRSRGRERWLSRTCAAAFYTVLRILSGFDLRGASDFKLLDRRVVEAWRRMPERNLFFRGMVAWLGFRRTRILFDVPGRVSGTSHWSTFALLRLATGAITAFSSAMLQLVTVVGLLFLAFSLVLGAQTLYLKIRGQAVTGFTTVILLLLIIGSLLMISLGLIGLYLARIYDEVKARPRCVVAEEVGFEDDTVAEGVHHGMDGRAFSPAPAARRPL